MHPRLCNADRGEDIARRAHPNRRLSSEGVQKQPGINLRSSVLNGDNNLRVNLPAGKASSPITSGTGLISQNTGVWSGLEQHYPTDAHQQRTIKVQQQQVAPSSQHLQQPPVQLPPCPTWSFPSVPSVSSQCILLLEREVQLEKDLDVVTGQKALMRDTDSRECYIAVLKQEIAIRKQLEQVI